MKPFAFRSHDNDFVIRIELSPVRRLLFLLVAVLMLVSCSSEESDPGSSIRGVWEYTRDDVLNDVRGMSFFTEDHFAFVVNYKADPADEGYSILAHSGTYEITDSVVTATIMYSANPSFAGQKLRWIHKTEGSTATYEILNSEGRIVETGKVRKIE